VHPGGAYGLLEPIAQYARSRLAGQEQADAQRAHALHHLAVAERAHEAYARAEQLQALELVERLDDDMVLALERSLAAGDGNTAARLVWALQRYWWFRSRVPTGRRLCERVVHSPFLTPAELAVASLAAACMAFALDDPDTAHHHWSTAYRLSDDVREVGVGVDVDVAANAAPGLALVAMARGDLAAALALVDEAEEQASRGTHSSCAWVVSMCQIWRGTLLRATGDPDGARASVERGLQGARERGDRLAVYMALFGLGHGALLAGDHEEARRQLEAGLRLAHELGDTMNVAHFAQTLEVVEVAAGEHGRAAVLRGASDALLETFGAGGDSYRLLSREALATARDQARAALGDDAYDDAVDTGRALPPEGLGELVTPASGRLRLVEPRRASS
jgi:tetratricopeptide (TPR) repeat protein